MQQDASAGAGSKTDASSKTDLRQADASACNWTQAAKRTQVQTQQDANADASSKTDASADATGRKCGRKHQNGGKASGCTLARRDAPHSSQR